MREHVPAPIGKRFGRWTVVGDGADAARHRKRWRCRCDCGSERDVVPALLLRGMSRSCGCLRRELSSARRSLPIKAGNRFGRYSIVREEPRLTNNRRRFLCRCDCGTEKVVELEHLRSGGTQSCGCFLRQRRSEVHRKHGESRITPEYRAWKDMITRCGNPHCDRYPRYGGRGILVCQEWRHSYETFLAWVGRRPSPTHSLHRIENDGPYAPGNVEWQTRKHQANHTGHNVFVEIDGRRLSVAEWCDELGQSRKLAYQRIATGWDPVRALTIPVGGRRAA